jgi:predicted lipoprotein with Yx(FWY)xxD motif
MRRIVVLLSVAALTLAACGSDDDYGSADSEPVPTQAAPAQTDTSADTKPAEPRGTTITLRDSEYGTMLFDSRKQAIYIFENDSKDKTVCYDECAEAWPPVYTKGEPRAADGVKQSLLGTIERRDGRKQVTYAGKPLYFYAHEEPGEVRCHNIDLNGGLWWVVGPDGKRRP